MYNGKVHGRKFASKKDCLSTVLLVIVVEKGCASLTSYSRGTSELLL